MYEGEGVGERELFLTMYWSESTSPLPERSRESVEPTNSEFITFDQVTGSLITLSYVVTMLLGVMCVRLVNPNPSTPSPKPLT